MAGRAKIGNFRGLVEFHPHTMTHKVPHHGAAVCFHKLLHGVGDVKMCIRDRGASSPVSFLNFTEERLASRTSITSPAFTRKEGMSLSLIHIYYHVEKGSEQYVLISQVAKGMLRDLAGLEKDADLSTVDLQKAAESYLTGIGLTAEQISALKTNLSTPAAQ